MNNCENWKSLVPKSYIESSLPTSASNTTPPNKKILGERNVYGTLTPNTENLDFKPLKAEKGASCELDISPDPMTNYPSPRPMYLRYKPNRRKEIFLKLEKEAKEGENLDSNLSSCLSPEVEEEEENYGSEGEIEEEEESYISSWKELLMKSLFLCIALALCSSYICNQNGGTQNLSLGAENFTSQGLSSFNGFRDERGNENQMFLVLIEGESKTIDPNMPKRADIGPEVDRENEEAEFSHDIVTEESEIQHEKETQEGDQENVNAASEIMFHFVKTQLESNPEQIIEKRNVIFRPSIGVLISSLVLASLVTGVFLMKKKNSSSNASLETTTLQVESLMGDEAKGDLGSEDMCKKPSDSFTDKLPSYPMEEFGRVVSQSWVPVIQLLSELEIGEVSISSQRRSRISGGKESIYSASLEKTQLKGGPVDWSFSRFSSADYSASNGRLLSDRRSINQENNWTEGHSRKEINATPLRRSSRIRNRSSIQSP